MSNTTVCEFAERSDDAVKREAWRPLLGGTLAKRARLAIAAVATETLEPTRRPSHPPVIAARKKTTRDPSLSSGAAGLAIFYGYLSRAHPRSRYGQAARGFLREAGDALKSVTMGFSLYAGFSGVAWAIAHLEGRLGETNAGYSTEAVDEALSDFVSRPGWEVEYDLIIGLVGLGVYALERLPAPGAISCLEGVIDRLEETAERQAGGITWHTAPELLVPKQRKWCPHGYYNVGLAHGVPGVIALLGAACAAGVRRRKARKLLDGAVAWLRRQQLENGPGSRFPAWVVPGVKSAGCRSAWCYGDPGVAAALFCAARCVGEPAWEREALKIAWAAADRPHDQAGVEDPGLCHGAAGLGHVFNRMYQATGDATLRRAARFWFERTLAMRQPGRGVGGFSALWVNEDGTTNWGNDSGLLTGASGVALALLAATASVEPSWDRMLLVSVPVQQ